jgi:hypothetical protein
MFLNASEDAIEDGEVVPGSALIWASAGDVNGGTNQPSGSWSCLGYAAANTATWTANPDCISIFKRVL